MIYAEDIAAIISAGYMFDARRKLNQVMIRTRTFLEDHGLEIAENKTEVILLIREYILLEINMQIPYRSGEVLRCEVRLQAHLLGTSTACSD